MQIKNLQPNGQVYVYDRDNTTLKVARVVSVSQPHYDTNNFNGNGGYNYNPGQNYNFQKYVDLVIEIDGKVSAPYVCPENSEVVSTNNLAISPDINPLIREVESTKNGIEHQLSQRESLEEKVKRCTEILTAYNPAFKERKEIDSRFEKIESGQSKLESMMQELLNKLS